METVLVKQVMSLLSSGEREEFVCHETVIERGLATFIEVGNALAVIRDKQLYRESYRTFEEYCQRRWGLRRAHAYRLIEGADVVENLSPIGDKLQTGSINNGFPLPANEAQARPLTRLEPEQQREAWREAIETAPDGKITAAHVEQVVARIKPTMVAHYSSDTPEWHTPPKIIKLILRVFDEIDLDPCSNSAKVPNVPAAEHYTKDDDGLSQTWHGRIYMNPPYGREIAKWVEHLCKEYGQGNISEAIALVPARTDTGWFRQLRAYPRCFIWGRLRFSDNETGAPFPSMAVYLGENVSKFMEAFEDIGDIYVWSPTGREAKSI